MATGKSGVLTLSGTNVTVQITWNETYEISTNTSIVTITSLGFKSSAASYFLDGYLTVNGKEVATFDSGLGTHVVNVVNTSSYWPVEDSNRNTEFKWESSNIAHDNDGSKQISIGINVKTYKYPSGSSGWNINTSGTVSLTTIPRASSFDSLSCSNSYFNGIITYKYTPKSTNFYNQIKIYIKTGTDTYVGLETIKLGKKAATQQTSTISLSNDDLLTIYSKLPTETKGTLRFLLRTYSDEYQTQVGNTVSKDISLTIPTTVTPKLGTITLKVDGITTSDGINRNILVQKKNKIKVNINGCEAGSGSNIKSYTFDVLSGSTIIATTTTTSTSASFGPFSYIGNLKFRVTVTDARNRYVNNANSEPVYCCYEYFAPSFKLFNAYRAKNTGDVDANGSYLMLVYSENHASVNDTNNIIITAYYNNQKQNIENLQDGNLLIDLNGDTDTTYQVSLKITDNYGGSATSSVITVFGSTRIFNITADGTGFSIGKMAESSELFECRWDAKFDGDVSGPNGFSTSSDERVKKNIQDINIDIIDSLRPIQYELIQSTDGKTHYGFVAQEVEGLLSNAGVNPELLGIIGQVTNKGQKEYVLTYTEFIPLLTKKCQDLQSETNILKQEIAELKDMIKQISS